VRLAVLAEMQILIVERLSSIDSPHPVQMMVALHVNRDNYLLHSLAKLAEVPDDP
jgi:hypothetical protein